MSTAIAAYHGQFGRAVVYRLNRPIKQHAHREGHLIFHIDGPSAWSRSARGPALLRPGWAAAISPWDPHEYIPGDRHGGSLYLVLYILPDWFATIGQAGAEALQFGRTELGLTPTIAHLVERIFWALANGTAPGCLDTEIFDLTAESFRASWHGVVSPNAVLVRHGSADYRIRRSARLIADRLGREVELDEIAREAGLSRPHFYKLFRAQMGVTPHVYLDTLRMERAVERLTMSNDSVIDIGLLLGFESHSGFSRFFSAHVGVAPVDYRRVALRVPA